MPTSRQRGGLEGDGWAWFVPRADFREASGKLREDPTPLDPPTRTVHALEKNLDQPAADADLIAASLDGRDEAFASLVGRYEDRVFRLVSRYTRDRSEAEDLAQDVFVKVFHKLHTFQQDSAFFTWVYRIAVNTANDHATRKSRRHMRLVDDDSALDGLRGRSGGHEDIDATTPLMEAEVHEATRNIVDSLPEKYRTILVLREWEDLSYTDMAEVLQCSIGTVESRLFRARKRFREALERRHPELVPQPGGKR